MVHCNAGAKTLLQHCNEQYIYCIDENGPPVVTHPGVSSQLQQGQEVKVFQDAILDKVHVVVRQIQLMKMQQA